MSVYIVILPILGMLIKRGLFYRQIGDIFRISCLFQFVMFLLLDILSVMPDLVALPFRFQIFSRRVVFTYIVCAFTSHMLAMLYIAFEYFL